MFDKYFIALCVHFLIATCLVTILYAQFYSFAFIYTKIAYLILYAYITFFTFGLTKKYFCGEKICPKNKAVLITGCDSGFGYHLAKRLDSRGFKVFAGCLFPQGDGAVDLQNTCSNKLQVLHIDVSDDECINNALSFVKENIGNADLWALVNNAGISKGFFIELTSLDAFRDVYNVNSLGMVRMTKTFLHLIKQAKGRVINVTSLEARSTHIGLAAYAMSKHAAVAFTECLSQEMKPWSVRVISVAPDFFRTPITDVKMLCKGVDEEFSKNSPEVKAAYGEEFIENFKTFACGLIKWASPHIHIVTKDLESAIMDVFPDHEYKPRQNIFTRIGIYIDENLPVAFREYMYSKVLNIVGFPPYNNKNKHI